MVEHLLYKIDLAEFPEELVSILDEAKVMSLKLKGKEAKQVVALIADKCRNKLSELTPEMHRNDNNIKNYDDIRG